MLSLKSNSLVLILGCAVLFGCGTKTSAPSPIEDAKLLLFQGKHDEAIAKCDDLIRIDEHDFQAYMVRGQVHEKMDDLQTALADYSSAIEAAPNHHEPYDYRYQLYVKLAQQAEENDERFRLETLAASDRRAVAERDPEASVAYKNEMRQPHPLLTEPIPKTPDKYNNKPVVEESLLAKDKDEEGKDGQANAFRKKTKDADKEREEIEDEGKDGVNESAADYAARQKLEAENIRNKELGGVPDHLALPPHLDPETATIPPLPERPITKFSLPTDTDGRLILPPTTRPQTTGLTSRNTAEESDSTGEPTGPTSRFFLQNQGLGGTNQFSSALPNQQPGVRTGIGSSRATTSGGLGPRSGGLQLGFMPPEARNSFGPRIVFDADETLKPPTGRATLPTEPEKGTILSNALPGTLIFYGSANGGVQNTGNANLGQARAGGTQSGATRSISSPSYSPFGAQPTTTLPILPPQPTTNAFPVTRSGVSN